MVIIKGSVDYHIAYGLHSNIKKCCIVMWVFDTKDADIAIRISERNKYMRGCNYVPCLKCIEKRKYNKIVDCSRHKKPCDFIPEGRDWRMGPPEKFKISKGLEKDMQRFKKKYFIL